MNNLEGIIFDIEVAKNLFYIHFHNLISEEEIGFEFSERKWERNELGNFLKKYRNYYFIGFNNIKYDAPILTNFISFLTHIKDKNKVLSKIFNLSKDIIKKDLKLPYTIFKHIDLAEIGGFNTKATSASLKQIEFNLKLENIETIPFDVTKPIPLNKIDQVIYYCKNDVFATLKLYYDLIELIKVRLDPTYDNILNLPNTKLGEMIIQQELGLNTLYINREEFDYVEIKDIIFDYIKFEIPVFNNLLDWFKTKKINKPAGFFNLIDFEEIKDLEGYYDRVVKKGKLKNLNVVFNGIVLNLGAGGLHASRRGIFTTNSKRIIIDIDVNSYYPNLSIENKMIPEMVRNFLLSVNKNPEFFTEVYSSFKEKRKLYKKPHALNLFYKLALNILFGKSLQPSSIFGDLEYGLKTTINGQLSLLMLIESLSINIPDFVIIQANTDGITIQIDRYYLDKVEDTISEWENMTKLNMEQTIYNRMVIADVNNYIAITEKGKIKRKGIFGYTKDELPHNKDYSQLIVSKALEQFYLYEVPYRKYIKNHTDIYDFCKRAKIDKYTKLVYRIEDNAIPFEEEYGKITRYIITKKGGKLVKIMKPLKDNTESREILVEASNLVMPLQHIDNTIAKKALELLNYDYYIKEVEKVRSKIEPEFLLKIFKNKLL